MPHTSLKRADASLKKNEKKVTHDRAQKSEARALRSPLRVEPGRVRKRSWGAIIRPYQYQNNFWCLETL